VRSEGRIRASRDFRFLRIMIVEDDVLISSALAEIVRGYGHEVVGVADTAADALACAGRFRPDLALMDIALSGPGGGIEAAVGLRAAYDIRTIFVTGHTDVATRDRAQAAWPLGMIGKPIHPARLHAALRNASGTLAALASRGF
jgi:DNA-binding NarL/FixJ family response regulator